MAPVAEAEVRDSTTTRALPLHGATAQGLVKIRVSSLATGQGEEEDGLGGLGQTQGHIRG